MRILRTNVVWRGCIQQRQEPQERHPQGHRKEPSQACLRILCNRFVRSKVSQPKATLADCGLTSAAAGTTWLVTIIEADVPLIQRTPTFPATLHLSVALRLSLGRMQLAKRTITSSDARTILNRPIPVDTVTLLTICKSLSIHSFCLLYLTL